MLLLLSEVVEKLGDVPRSTVSDWIKDYAQFIPTAMDGNTKYYQSEAIDVLLEIKKLKHAGMKKPNILKKLEESGFIITIDQAQEEIKHELQKEVTVDKREDLMTMFTIMTTSIQTLSEQKELIEAQAKKIDSLEKRLLLLEAPKKKKRFWLF